MKKQSSFLLILMPVIVVLGVIALNIPWASTYSPLYKNTAYRLFASVSIYAVPISVLLIPFGVRQNIGKTVSFGLLIGCLIWLVGWFIALLFLIRLIPTGTQNWLESGKMTIDQLSEFYLGIAFNWGSLSLIVVLLVFLGGNLLAINAMIYTQNNLRSSPLERAHQADWRGAVLSISLFIFCLAGSLESDIFASIFDAVFVFQAVSWSEKVIYVTIAFILVCVILFSCFASLDFLFGKSKKVLFVHKATLVLEIISLVGAIALAIVLTLISAFRLIENIPFLPQFIIIGIYIPFFLALVWEPRGLVNVTKEKIHKLLLQVSFWGRVILLPVTSHLLNELFREYVQETFEWVSVVLFIATIYYAYCGFLQLLLLIPGFRKWFEKRVKIMNLKGPEETKLAATSGSDANKSSKIDLDQWVRRFTPKSWWMSEDNQTPQPAIKVLLFGISSWVIMKVLDVVVENLLNRALF